MLKRMWRESFAAAARFGLNSPSPPPWTASCQSWSVVGSAGREFNESHDAYLDYDRRRIGARRRRLCRTTGRKAAGIDLFGPGATAVSDRSAKRLEVWCSRPYDGFRGSG